MNTPVLLTRCSDATSFINPTLYRQRFGVGILPTRLTLAVASRTVVTPARFALSDTTVIFICICHHRSVVCQPARQTCVHLPVRSPTLRRQIGGMRKRLPPRFVFTVHGLSRDTAKARPIAHTYFNILNRGLGGRTLYSSAGHKPVFINLTSLAASSAGSMNFTTFGKPTG